MWAPEIQAGFRFPPIGWVIESGRKMEKRKGVVCAVFRSACKFSMLSRKFSSRIFMKTLINLIKIPSPPLGPWTTKELTRVGAPCSFGGFLCKRENHKSQQSWCERDSRVKKWMKTVSAGSITHLQHACRSLFVAASSCIIFGPPPPAPLRTHSPNTVVDCARPVSDDGERLYCSFPMTHRAATISLLGLSCRSAEGFVGVHDILFVQQIGW